MLFRDDLVEFQKAPDGDFKVDYSSRLLSNTQKYSMLEEVEVDTKDLQARDYTLASLRDEYNVLIEFLEEERGLIDSVLYRCQLGT